MATAEVLRTSAARTGRGLAQETLLHGMAVAGLVLWHVGAHVDIWSHIHYGFEIESFFTWSHALFYAGWAASGLLVLAYQLLTRAPLPPAFRTYLLGVAMFGVGGALDFVWHSLFGFEVSQSAVLSPAHLWLALAFALAVFGLLEATARWRGRNAPTGSMLRLVDIPLILSLAMLLRVTTWYATYADPLTVDFADGGAIAGGLQGYAGLDWQGMTAQVAATAGIFLRSVILALFLIVLLHCLRLPSGSIALVMLYDALLIVAATGQWPALLSVAGAALAGEVGWAWIQRGGFGGPEERAGYWILGGTVPLVQAVLGLAMLDVFAGPVAWSVHVWAGVPLTAGIVGLTASILAVPPVFLSRLASER